MMTSHAGVSVLADATGLVVPLAVAGVPSDGSIDLVVRVAYLLAAGGSIASIARLLRSGGMTERARHGWQLLQAALVISGLGVLLWANLATQPRPMPADAVTFVVSLAFNVLMVLALSQFAAPRRTRAAWVALLLDTALVMIPVGIVVWHTMVEPLVMVRQSAPWELSLDVLFPLANLALLAALAAVTVERPTSIGHRSLAVLALGILLFATSDIVRANQATSGLLDAGGAAAACWLGAALLPGLAALLQRRAASRAIVSLADRPAPRGPLPGAVGHLLPSLGAAAGYGLLIAEASRVGAAHWVELALGTALLTVCTLARHVVAWRTHERLLADRARQHGEARFSALVRHARDPVAILDADGRINYISPAVQALLGHDPAALQRTSLLALIHDADAPVARALLADALGRPGTMPAADLRLVRTDGSLRDVELRAANLLDDAGVRGVMVTCHDVTERRAFERELADQVGHDRLTGLPNRTLLLEGLGRAMARARRHQTLLAVLLVDLDNFKLVNESFSHQIGDDLLVLVAERLRGCLRGEDTLARMGGDELAILLEDIRTEADAVIVATRILDALAAPFTLGRQDVFTTASIGIALSGSDVDSPANLLRSADLAMYQAKARGKACWAIFDPDANASVLDRLALETDLRVALERGELRVVYQPVVELATGRIREIEALVRWAHPTRGEISPVRFIPIAEETGLIAQIGAWVLREACRQTVAWRETWADADALVVGVNLSGRQMRDPAFVDLVARTLDETGLEGSALKLELTESLVIEYAQTTLDTLRGLRDLGVRLVIDDFGTGYSSLSYLKRFPVDALKIDRSFVDGIEHSPQDGAIVQGVIGLAQSLGLAVTCEGIETAEQAACLTRLGCELAQGYYFARPQSADRLTPILLDPAGLHPGQGAPVRQAPRVPPPAASIIPPPEADEQPAISAA